MVGFTLSETVIATAQPNQLNNISMPTQAPPSHTTDIKFGSDDNRIILTWLKMNGTDIAQSEPAPTLNIDKHDFLKAFGQLFENSNNNSNAIE
jgi:hypothetical protein